MYVMYVMYVMSVSQLVSKSLARPQNPMRYHLLEVCSQVWDQAIAAVVYNHCAQLCQNVILYACSTLMVSWSMASFVSHL